MKTITVSPAPALPVGDFFTIAGVEEKHTSLHSGNAIKDAFPFLFKFNYRPTVFKVIGKSGSTLSCEKGI